MTVQVLNENNFDTETNTGTTLVDFYADWCGPCRMLTPIIESIAEDLQGKANVVKVDVDKSPKLAARFGVRACGEDDPDTGSEDTASVQEIEQVSANFYCG